MSYKYLASPYSVLNAEQLTEQQIKNRLTRRYKRVCKKAAELMLKGDNVFCPIAHSHPIEIHGIKVRKDGDFWLKQDFALLKTADELVVYKMPGWEKSYGVSKEIEFAESNGIPVSYLDA